MKNVPKLKTKLVLSNKHVTVNLIATLPLKNENCAH